MTDSLPPPSAGLSSKCAIAAAIAGVLFSLPGLAFAAPALELGDLNGFNGIRIQGFGDQSGKSYAAATDINGDGLPDLLIGAPDANVWGYGIFRGRTYVIFGGSLPVAPALELEDLDHPAGFKVEGAEVGLAGASLAAGDLNGDGIDDIMIGAPYSRVDGEYAGATFVVFGTSEPRAEPLSLGELDGTNGFRIGGADSFDRSGAALASLDLNGDGVSDLVIGAFSRSNEDVGAGSTYVVFGSSAGFQGHVDLDLLDGENGVRLDGGEYDHSGRSVANAGDVNGDGLEDLIIGAPGYQLFGEASGKAYVVFGRDSHFPPVVDLTALDGSSGFRISSEVGDDAFGCATSPAGDFNADGYADLLVGAPEKFDGDRDSGAAFLVFGRPQFPAVFAAQSMTATEGFGFSGAPGERVGASVSGAGDVNSDGFDDLLIGSEAGLNAPGSAHLVFGGFSHSGLEPLSELDGTNGFRMDGEASGDLLGYAVAGAGDLNADGFADFVVGAPRAADESGISYLIYGREQFFQFDIFSHGFESPGPQ